MIFNKDKVYLAFYKGNDKLLDKIITWTSRGIYSHVEIIIDNVSYSSSGRDGGVRRKALGTMHYNDVNKWDIFELKVEDANLFKELSFINFLTTSLAQVFIEAFKFLSISFPPFLII